MLNGRSSQCNEMTVRKTAVETLGKLDAAALAQNAAALVATLVNDIWGVRVAAIETLGRLGAEALAQHEPALAKAAKEDKSQAVRKTACLVMHTLKPSAGYDTYAKLDDSVWEVRVAAVETLSKLDATALAPHLPAIVATLEDRNAGASLPSTFIASVTPGRATGWHPGGKRAPASRSSSVATMAGR